MDRALGRPLQHKYVCTTRDGRGFYDLSYLGNPEYVKCESCNGGRLRREIRDAYDKERRSSFEHHVNLERAHQSLKMFANAVGSEKPCCRRRRCKCGR